MKRLRFDYNMKLSYSEDVYNEHFDLKCVPVCDGMQEVEEVNINIEPECNYSMGKDSFGNNKVYGSVEEAHRFLKVRVSGIVKTGLNESILEADAAGLGLYKVQTKYTKPGSFIKNYFENLKLNEYKDVTAKISYIMQSLYEDFCYQAAVTTAKTTAEEAMGLGKGVCQDYSHIFISLLRLSGLPARYVAGMVMGEGESHAWVEIYINGCWCGFDPTNNKKSDSNYIKFAVGRDCSDCMLNRGVLTGGGFQHQNVNVIVEEC